jgi:beta-glucosidase
MINKPWLDPTLDIPTRAKLLLAAMTIPEKVGQLMQLDGQKRYRELLEEFHAGSFLHINGADADAAIEASLATRLGIPVLLADDAIHGHSFWAGATIFPTQLALACSWNTELLTEVARVTAREMRATGLKWNFSPVLCLARDLRWGRVGETFGEDPFLIGEFGMAMIKGYQGKGLADPDAVLATAKHFAGYSETLGGRDASEADLSRRKLASWFLPPFERAAREGCLAFMTGYQAIDGVPSTANRWLLRETLKDQWGFDGILVTDWNNVGTMVTDQKICADYAEAAALALRSGNDMIMATPEFYEGCQDAVARGLLAENEVDEVVARVLALKFALGLFENPGKCDAAKISGINGAEHQAVNLKAARESLVLLRNDPVGNKPVLPFDLTTRKTIALLGPNADNPLAQLGDWSLGVGQMVGANGAAHPRGAIVTVADGLRELLPAGWRLVGESEVGQADLVVLVIGDDIPWIGEGKSTATLELQNGQVELAERAMALGRPVVVVLINSKPLVLPACLKAAPAIIEAFNPGMKGGRAIAEALFGHFNPSGKLTVSFPVHVGQQPVWYNQVRGQHGGRYADLSQEPAFAFGYGLNYSQFVFGPPRLDYDTIRMDDTLRVRIDLTNVSERAGVEVVQVYIEDMVTSATWAVRELKAFSRVTLAAGESRTIHFELPARVMSVVDALGQRVVEPGLFKVSIGNSSRSEDLQSREFRVVF